MYKITKYKKESGECPFNTFINDLLKGGSKKDVAKIFSYIKLLEQIGDEILTNSTWAKKLNNQIYELRPKSNRIIYFFFECNNEYVLLHGFKKKTQKTPAEEIEKAIFEMADYERRMKND